VIEDLPEAYLIDVTGITNKSTFQIRKRITRIGRTEANDLYIPDEHSYVSSLHAILEFSGQNFYIIDQDSVNGTFVNGSRIEKKERIILKGGDEISFDKFAFKFLCPVEGERGQTVLNVGTTTGTNTVQHLPEVEDAQGSNPKE
jgi:pSer/pThr/pTyr-binding forkhead associated (FHA) protein